MASVYDEWAIGCWTELVVWQAAASAAKVNRDANRVFKQPAQTAITQTSLITGQLARIFLPKQTGSTEVEAYDSDLDGQSTRQRLTYLRTCLELSRYKWTGGGQLTDVLCYRRFFCPLDRCLNQVLLSLKQFIQVSSQSRTSLSHRL